MVVYSKYSFLTQKDNMRQYFAEQLINPDLDIENYVQEFKENKVVVIQNFLKEDQAEIMYNWFNNEMPSDWWEASSFPGIKEKKVAFVRNLPENQEKIFENYQHVIKEFRDGNFAYHFYRTDKNHVEGCDCHECEVREFLDSQEILDFISKVSGDKKTHTDEVFAACYTAGDFLSPHLDSPNGSLGFVYQMTKNWLPQYGGLLHFMDDDKTRVERVEVPEFNSLTLFYLPPGKGKWHYVSHVSPGVEEMRLTYTGWYK